MNTKVWFDVCTVVSVVFLIGAALKTAGTISGSWSATLLIIWAAAFFVARDYQW